MNAGTLDALRGEDKVQTPHILVVDDEEANRALIQRLLGSMGYDAVSTAANGLEALERLRAPESAFDMVLLDVMMPGCDGVSVIEAMRDDGRLKSIPVIMISALGDREAVRRCIELGADDFLQKPFDKSIFQARVNATLEKKKSFDRTISRLRDFDNVTGMRRLPRLIADVNQLFVSANRDRFGIVAFGIKIDQTANVGSAHGSAAADRFLAQIAEDLDQFFPDDCLSGVPARGEFAFVLRTDLNTATEEAVALIRRLSTTLAEKRVSIGTRTVGITASIGLAFRSPGGRCDADTLLNRASLAMREVINSGGNGYTVFDTGMHDRVIERLYLEADLIGVTERNELQTYFQPIISASDGQIVGFESLLRWSHPEIGMISPGAFIPIAEEMGEIGKMGNWVLNDSLRAVSSWPKFGGKRVVNINVSGRQLTLPGYAGTVIRSIERAGIAPEQVKLEVTESALMAESDRGMAVLRALEEAGVQLAIDDFGTGYSSFKILLSFPFDTLKIDRSFVSGIEGNPRNRKIVGTITMMAHDVGMDVVAEGVETESEFAAIAEQGVDYAQGYYFARPMSAVDANALLDEEPTWSRTGV